MTYPRFLVEWELEEEGSVRGVYAELFKHPLPAPYLLTKEQTEALEQAMRKSLTLWLTGVIQPVSADLIKFPPIPEGADS